MASPAGQLDEPPTPTEAWDVRAQLPADFGHYRFLGVLGQGGMGTVYRAFHVNLRRPVAIKTLRFDRASRRGFAERFQREMRAIGQFDHPNVVRAHDGGERDGTLYLVMELLDGADLNALVERHGFLGRSEERRVGKEC